MNITWNGIELEVSVYCSKDIETGEILFEVEEAITPGGYDLVSLLTPEALQELDQYVERVGEEDAVEARGRAIEDANA